MKKILSVIIVILLLISLTACNDYGQRIENSHSPEFRFDIEIIKPENLPTRLTGDNIACFALRVTTTYTPSDPNLFYNVADGEMTGGHPLIILPDGGSIGPVTDLLLDKKQELGNGESITNDWYFALPWDFVWGKYDIKVIGLGETSTFTNVEITPENCYLIPEYTDTPDVTDPPESTVQPSIKTARFDFDLEISRIKYLKAEDVYFSDVDLFSIEFKVTTTCTSGQYKYWSGSYPGFDGGIPTIILPDGGEVKHESMDIQPMETIVDINPGDKTERYWSFLVPADFAWGEYDIRVECDNGQTKIFENVLIEYKE